MRIGAVVIGRNEGDRLRACLESLIGRVATLVYVDSGSTDDSVSLAREQGAEVVELDLSKPFTAARARNAGFQCLRSQAPQLAYVQFADGDCEVQHDWLSAAAAFLDENRHVAVVCGRRRERFPDKSIYNWLCDMEWDTPVGRTKSCGGDALMRIDAFDQVGGFRDDLIAGEEPELCVRLRTGGWQVWRLDAEMTRHDAAMTRLGQWWRRAARSGYAFAQGAALHGSTSERHWVWEARRAMLWGVYLPSLILALTSVFGRSALFLLLIYPAQIMKQIARERGTIRRRFLIALFQLMARFAEAYGHILYLRDRLMLRQREILEYK